MTELPEWLPSLVLFEDYRGNWDAYLSVIYAAFVRDFVESSPEFQGRRLGLKRYPLFEGKEATFWHMIQEGEDEQERTPDFRRCERIRWPKPIIEHDADRTVLLWRNKRRTEERICLLFQPEDYIVILADRGEYILPWTAYLVDREHTKEKLLREYKAYWAEKAQKS